MKTSDIYKYALTATINALAHDQTYGQLSQTEVYEIVGEICEKIGVELFSESRKEGKQA